VAFRDDKRRKTSLFRKLSSRKATAEMNQMLSGSQSLNSLRSDMSTGSIGAGASATSPGVITSIRHSTSTPDPQSDSSSPADSAPCSPVTTGNIIFYVKLI
jgi:microtubule-associated serine/threonine kinase